MSGLLQIDDLQVRYRTAQREILAVAGATLHLDAGETLGLVGESGSGKSSIGMAVPGLLGPAARCSGRIRFEGQDILAAKERQLRRLRGSRIGMIFQDPMTSLNPYLRVGMQVAEPLRLHHGLDRRQARTRVIELLHEVGIPEAQRRLDRHPHEFSGGQRQRLMIAMALACRPSLLIADEPTTALDVTVQAQVLALLKDLQERHGLGLLLITHDMGVVAGMCDRVAVMQDGRIVEAAACDQLFAAPQHVYTRSLLAAVPRLDPEAER